MCRSGRRSNGLPKEATTTLYDLGGAAIVQWEQRLVSRLFLVVGVRAGLRLHEDGFTVTLDGVETKLLTVSPLRLSASIGLGWQLL